MNDPFEKRLAAIPRAPLDREWRATILGAAGQTAPAVTPFPNRSPHDAGWTWAWSALAAIWLVILMLHQFAKAPESASRAPQWTESTPANLRHRLDERRNLWSMLLEDSPAAAPDPRSRPKLDPLPPRGDRSGPDLGGRRDISRSALA